MDTTCTTTTCESNQQTDPSSSTFTLDKLNEDVLAIISEYLDVNRPFPGCMGALYARATCSSLRCAVDNGARATLRRMLREFCAANIELQSKAREGLANALCAAQVSANLNATFVEKLVFDFEKTGNSPNESLLEPHRSHVHVLASTSNAGGSGSDYEDCSSGSTITLTIPLAPASQSALHASLRLGVHRLEQHAYSARYQEHANDDLVLVWLELSDAKEGASEALDDAARKLGLQTLSSDRCLNRTKPKVVFAGQTTFYGEHDAGLDLAFFGRLKALLGLPNVVHSPRYPWESNIDVTDVWSAMLWLSMHASHSGEALWEWMAEHPGVTDTPPDVSSMIDDPKLLIDPWLAAHIPKPLVREWLSSAEVYSAIDRLDKHGCSAIINDINLIDACTRLRSNIPALESGLRQWESQRVGESTLMARLLRKPWCHLIALEEDSHSSRHDYCATANIEAKIALPLLTTAPNGEAICVEVRVQLSKGSGYENDDRHSHVSLRLPTSEAATAFNVGLPVVKGESKGLSTCNDQMWDGSCVAQPVGRWETLFTRNPESYGPGCGQGNSHFKPTPLMDHLAEMVGSTKNPSQEAELLTLLLVGIAVCASATLGSNHKYVLGATQQFAFGEDDE